MLFSTPAVGLFNGVSQQSAPLRLGTQAEAQLNCVGSLMFGLTKRPNTTHNQILAIETKPFVYFIDRDGTEKYMVIIGGTQIEPVIVYSLIDGTKKTVRYGHFEGDVFVDSGFVGGYLNAENPAEAFRAVTIADHTFLVNRTVPVSLMEQVPEVPPNRAMVWFKRVNPGAWFEVTLNGTPIRVLASADSTSPDYSLELADTFHTNINGTAGFKSTSFGSVLVVEKTDGSAFTISTADGVGNEGIVLVTNTASGIDDLPPRTLDGYKVRVNGNTEKLTDDFFMRYSQDAYGKGRWKECDGWDGSMEFDASTMPHKIVRLPDGDFGVSPIEWTARMVGDNESHPAPSFVGAGIQNVFFHRNRLGLLTKHNAILSKTGSYYNFFRRSMLDLLDDDPIDLGSISKRVVDFHSTATHNKKLMAIGTQEQLFLDSGNAPFTAKTAAFTQASQCLTAPTDPCMAGSTVFFVSPRKDYVDIREYYIQPDTQSEEAANVTLHVPKYIKAGTISLANCDSKDLLLVHTSAEPSQLIYHRYFWSGTEKAQNSWSTWDFGAPIWGFGIVGTTLHLLVLRADGVCWEQMDLDADLMTVVKAIYLDRWCSVQGVHDPVNDITTWTLPYAADETMDMVEPGSYQSIIGFYVENGVLKYKGNLSAYTMRIGVPFTSVYRPSRLFLKDAKGLSITTGRTQLRFMELTFKNTGYFRVEAQAPGRDKMKALEYTSAVVGLSFIGAHAPTSGRAKAFIMANADSVTIDIINDNFMPMIIEALTYTGFHSQLTRSI